MAAPAGGTNGGCDSDGAKAPNFWNLQRAKEEAPFDALAASFLLTVPVYCATGLIVGLEEDVHLRIGTTLLVWGAIYWVGRTMQPERSAKAKGD